MAEFGDTRLPARFWDKVSPEPNSGCWLWTAAADPNGYGRFGVPGEYRTVLAHRYAYGILVESPGSLCVCHRCDNPTCVNSHHMFLGDPTDNMRDMSRKGRHRLNNRPLANSRKTHCINGHPLTGAHVRQWKGHRICNTCHADRARAATSKRREQHGYSDC